MAASPRALAGIALVLAAGAAYANSFHGQFVFDDLGAVVGNPTLHSLWPGTVLRPPPGGFTVTGRPVLNLSLALNYAIGGLNPVGYHVGNGVIHVLGTLTLFGLLRRTVGSVAVAFGAALLWSVHPLQTEAVTYISQRAESLMGLFFLLSVYLFRLGNDHRDRRGPYRLALGAPVLCCWLGMGTKEVMAAAPLIVLLYDRTFVAGSFAAAWRQRWAYYCALASSWVLLAVEVVSGQSRGGTIGFNLGISWPGYLVIQASALVHYLRLFVWPAPLLFDYGLAPAYSPAALALAAAGLIVGLLAVSVWAVRRRPALGFWMVWFWAVLAPTSLVPGNRQTWAEHRMYLAVVPLALATAWLILRSRKIWSWPLAGVMAVLLGGTTFARNFDYRSRLSLWTDTVSKRPENYFAQYNLGEEEMQLKDFAAAEVALRQAVRLNADYAEAHNNLGNVLMQRGESGAARGEFATAARLKPHDATIRNNLGNSYLGSGELAAAEREYRAAMREDASFAQPHNGLGDALRHSRDYTGALEEYRTAMRLDPSLLAPRESAGTVLLTVSRIDEAMTMFASAAALSPNDASAHFNYANALAQQRRFGDAVKEYEIAVRIRPDDALTHYNYGTALVLDRRIADGRAQYQEALRLRPDFERARTRLRMLEGK